jgi:hypothetical protein
MNCESVKNCEKSMKSQVQVCVKKNIYILHTFTVGFTDYKNERNFI